MKRIVFGVLALLALVHIASALTTEVMQGEIKTLEAQNISTDFGMIIGTINFKLGHFLWPPKEIWLLSANVDPSVFSRQNTTLEIPENITFSTCRTAVYYNQTLNAIGFKIYNTASTTQILPNGTFCGLAYSGNYTIVAKW
jgi:hypothetical protein